MNVYYNKFAEAVDGDGEGEGGGVCDLTDRPVTLALLTLPTLESLLAQPESREGTDAVSSVYERLRTGRGGTEGLCKSPAREDASILILRLSGILELSNDLE